MFAFGVIEKVAVMKKKIHVVKFGSALLTQQDDTSQEVNRYAIGLLERYKDDGLIIVTSGAVATGKRLAAELGYARDELSAEQLAGVGFAPVFMAWQQAFARRGVAVATSGVTHHQLGRGRWYHRIANQGERSLFVQTLRTNASAQVVTVLNELDMISNVELMRLATGGDNDGLAAHTAAAVGAESLTLFSENGGIFDDSHRAIGQVDERNVRGVLQMLQGRSKSEAGRGGMDTKVRAAWSAVKAGVEHVEISDVKRVNITKFMIG